jgi:hypothetical protein
MEKPVKYLLILLLGLAVILGASGFSFVVHHCFTGDHTEITLKTGHSEGCCHHPDQQQSPATDNCCHREKEQQNSGQRDELSHQCCEEGLLSIQSLPVYLKTSLAEFSVQPKIIYLADISVIQGVSEALDFRYPPFLLTKSTGQNILLLNQVFLL